MHGVERDVSISVSESDFDDDQIVDVIEVFPDAVSCDARMNVMDQEVPGGTGLDLACDMVRKGKLAIVPHELSLRDVSFYHAFDCIVGLTRLPWI